MSAAVVFLIFNRPAETARTFAAIRAARPATLLVVADGPRPGRAGEAALCASTRAVTDAVDWPCEVHREYAEANMGCGVRVASGLDWAFSKVEAAIILEDDCLPDPSFFPFCTELLERYRADPRVMMISGDNFQNGAVRTADSYYFSRLPHCWGWATWRRAWRHFDFAMPGWRERRSSGWLGERFGDKALARHWQRCFDLVWRGRPDIWGYRWAYCMFVRDGLSAVPSVNLVSNLGFGATATHTAAIDSRYRVPSGAVGFPLRHPAVVARCEAADAFENDYLREPSPPAALLAVAPALRAVVGPLRPVLERIGLWQRLRALAIRFGL